MPCSTTEKRPDHTYGTDSKLRANARCLCLGVGTGSELIYLAKRFPGWKFVAVEPSAPMLDVCRRKAEEHGIADRCDFHGGYLDTLRPMVGFDAATSILVSQFILDRQARTDFFRLISYRLRSTGYLVNADLSYEAGLDEYSDLRDVWFRVMKAGDVSPEDIEKMRAAYDRDVAVLPPGEVEEIIKAGSFHPPVQFHQAGLIRAWYARKL